MRSAKLPTRGSGETLLVVDDEEPIQELLKKLLSRAGYRVMTAGGAREALRLYRENPGEVRLVLLDLYMPEISGHSLLQAFLRINPSQKILIVSGAPVSEEIQHALASGALDAISKPFDAHTLLSKIDSLIKT